MLEMLPYFSSLHFIHSDTTSHEQKELSTKTTVAVSISIEVYISLYGVYTLDLLEDKKLDDEEAIIDKRRNIY